MNILIAYATKHGCTEKCAKMLSEKLGGRVDVCSLKGGSIPNLEQYDSVIIGGSIYIGRIQKEVMEFCTKNMDMLKSKKIGLFICGMQQDDVIESEMKTSFPEELLSCAAAKEYFGGEFIFKKLGFMERMIVKKVSKIDNDTSNILYKNIERFAEQINNNQGPC